MLWDKPKISIQLTLLLFVIFTLPANKVVQKPNIAIRVNDHLKLNAAEINPIIGGPIRKPKKPIDDTAARATPGDIVLDFPASPYTKGTTDDTPIPTNKKPMVAVIIFGNSTAVNKPAAITIPLD